MMIKEGVAESLADFIQDRVSTTIGNSLFKQSTKKQQINKEYEIQIFPLISAKKQKFNFRKVTVINAKMSEYSLNR